MGQLKPISKESIPRALEKAERYRLLNEPFLAESICLDILAVDPDDQRALTIYALSLADQFSTGVEGGAPLARAALDKLSNEFDRLYFHGIVSERRAKAILDRGAHDQTAAAWHHIHDAMAYYERADALQRDVANDDAILRYNTCVRLIVAYGLAEPAPYADRQLE
ncbi:MAG: hypothetical protein ACHREM_04965 [Polyangiales bacterium]